MITAHVVIWLWFIFWLLAASAMDNLSDYHFGTLKLWAYFALLAGWVGAMLSLAAGAVKLIGTLAGY